MSSPTIPPDPYAVPLFTPQGEVNRQRLPWEAPEVPHDGGFPGHEADLGIGVEDLAQALAKRDQVVLVDPVDEERIGDFELDDLGAEHERYDRLEPGVERLLGLESGLYRDEDLPPEMSRNLW